MINRAFNWRFTYIDWNATLGALQSLQILFSHSSPAVGVRLDLARFSPRKKCHGVGGRWKREPRHHRHCRGHFYGDFMTTKCERRGKWSTFPRLALDNGQYGELEQTRGSFEFFMNSVWSDAHDCEQQSLGARIKRRTSGLEWAESVCFNWRPSKLDGAWFKVSSFTWLNESAKTSEVVAR